MRLNHLLSLAPCCVAWLSIACGGGGRQADATGGVGGGPSTNEPTGFAERDSAQLFGWPTIPTFSASLPAERWAYLKSHALEEQYEPAEVSFEGQSLGTVGIRFKGSIGTLQSCVDAQGNWTCAKLSMKLGFDEYQPKTRFFGLKRLNLHAMTRDDTKLHERLGYELYRTVGVIGPRSTWAILQVNGESYGLFAMVEQVDGRFASNRFPNDSNGNLYKEAWPTRSDPAYYEERLETEPADDAAAMHSVASALGNELASAADPSQARDSLARYADLDYLARYLAVDDAIVNVDGVTAMYTEMDPRFNQNHNYYLYVEQKQPHVWLVPWDLDATFLPRGDFADVPQWNSANADCSKTYLVWGNTNVASPACDPLFRAIAAEPTAYRKAVDKLLAGPFAEAELTAQIERYASFIEPAVAADPTGPGLESWRASVAALEQRVPLLRARLLRLRDGLSVRSFSLSVAEANGFETDDAAAVESGAIPIANVGTTVRASLNDQNALVGTHDLRLDFEYRNHGDPPANPWGQWIYFPLRLSEAPRSLSNLSGIRLSVRSDSSRTLRIDLESPEYEAPDEGIKYGWEVPIDATTQVIELRFSDAALPSWARSTSDSRDRVLPRVEGIAFHPFCAGRDTSGFLPAGMSDPGFLELDQIEFF